MIGDMENIMVDLLTIMRKLAEFPMTMPEVQRVRKLCATMLDLHRAVYLWTTDHDDLLRGIKSKPGREFPSQRVSAIVSARNPRKIRRAGATR
jgi:hypothetical protein